MTTDTSERGLEDLICTAMTGRAAVTPLPGIGVHAPIEAFGGTGWLLGDARDYDREYCVDREMLRAFMEATQPEIAAALELGNDTPVRRRFLVRLEHDKALARVMLTLLKDDTEAYKQFVENESFKRFVSDMVFQMTNFPPDISQPAVCP